MLTLYRRHSDTCPHRAKGQNYTKRSCPIWCDGEKNGKRVRKSVGVRDWARAVKRVAKWEDTTGELVREQTVAGAMESYLGDCRSRNLKQTTIISYRNTFDNLMTFCA